MARHAAFFLTAIASLAGCAAPQSTTTVTGYAKSVLNDLQGPSIAQGREFCGYIVRDQSGALDHTVAPAGSIDTCDYGYVPANAVASFHTHGDYNASYDSEIPSLDDARSSIDVALDDYLATPGGRFWVIGANGISRLLCDAGCLQSDPAYRPDPALPVDNVYAVQQLADIQS